MGNGPARASQQAVRSHVRTNLGYEITVALMILSLRRGYKPTVIILQELPDRLRLFDMQLHGPSYSDALLNTLSYAGCASVPACPWI